MSRFLFARWNAGLERVARKGAVCPHCPKTRSFPAWRFSSYLAFELWNDSVMRAQTRHVRTALAEEGAFVLTHSPFSAEFPTPDASFMTCWHLSKFSECLCYYPRSHQRCSCSSSPGNPHIRGPALSPPGRFAQEHSSAGREEMLTLKLTG